MSVANPLPRSTRQTDYVATEGQAVFGPAPWLAFDAADVRVRVRSATGQRFTTLTSGFTVSLSAAPAGFPTVTFATGQSAGRIVRVEGARIHERITDVTRAGGLDTAAMERELDKMSTVLQELRRDMADLQLRSIVSPDPEAGFDLPTAALRLGKIPIGNGDGGLSFIDPIPVTVNVPAPGSVVTASVAPNAITFDKIAVDIIRTPVAAEQILHFAAGGSNSNPGTLGSPLADGNEAWRILRDRMDGRGQNARLRMIGLNNVPLDVEGAPFGFREITLEGSTYVAGTLATWDDASFNAALNSQSVKVSREAKLVCQGFKVQNAIGHGLNAWQGGYIDYQHIAFGQCEAINGLHVWATQGGQMEMKGDCLIQAGAGAHIGISHNGRWRRSAGVSFLQANVAWGLACLYVLNGEGVATGTQPVGGTVNPAGFTPTGKQYLMEGDQAVIQSYGFQVPINGEFAGTLPGEFRGRDPFGPKRLGSVITPAAITTTPLHDWNPVGAGSGVNMKEVSRVRMSALGAVDLTGLFSAGVADGQLITLINIGAPTITLKHFNAGSIESSRFGLPAGADVALPQFTPITLCFDASLGTAGYWTLV